MTGSRFLEEIANYYEKVAHLLSAPIIKGISVGNVIYLIIAFVILFYVAKKVRHILEYKILVRANVTAGARATVGTLTRMFILFIGTVIIIQTTGVDLSALGLLAGALGVGIGFGLQNITSNLISGIIILFEKPIKIGDRIEVADVEGDVVSISFRATTILTNDNITIIVPNSDFIAQKVINWSHNDRSVRFKFPVGVSHKEDPERVRQILLDVADKNPNVLKKPEPRVFFADFGDSSLDFDLAVWTSIHTDKPKTLKSELYFEIFKQFKEQGIEIPFPQRDLHIRSDATKEK